MESTVKETPTVVILEDTHELSTKILAQIETLESILFGSGNTACDGPRSEQGGLDNVAKQIRGNLAGVNSRLENLLRRLIP